MGFWARGISQAARKKARQSWAWQLLTSDGRMRLENRLEQRWEPGSNLLWVL
jgi:hypothetical protein